MNLLPELWRLTLANSLRGSVFIAGVLLLRALLRGRVPAQCIHLLWVLVALRLLTPVVPQSSWSVFNLRHGDASTHPGSLPPSHWQVRLAESADTPHIHAKVVPLPLERIDPLAWLPVLWLVGCVAQGTALAIGAIVWRRRLGGATEITSAPLLSLARDCAGQIGWRGPLRLYETEALASPAVFGLWRPRVYLPRGLSDRLEEPALRGVLLHELAHLRRRDLAALWLLALTRAVHWFNPVVWLAVHAARGDVELACDETVLARLEPAGRTVYGGALLRLAQAAGSPRPALAAGMWEKGRALRARLQGIASYVPRSRARLLAGLSLAGLAAVSLAADEKPTAPIAATPQPAPHEEPPAPVAAARKTDTSPQWAQGWEVQGISIPATGDMRDAYVDFKTPTGRDVTLATGVWAKEGPMLDKVEWIGRPVRGRVTLKQGEETTMFFVDPPLISRKDELPPLSPEILIEARFIEGPAAILQEKVKSEVGPTDFSPNPKLALSGVLSPETTDRLVRACLQSRGISTLTSPKVTTKSGQAAVAEIIHEFHYVSEYEPKVKGKPWTPKTIETRNVGVNLSVTALLQEGGVIDVVVSPSVCEFLGFMNIDTGMPVTPPRDFSKSYFERFNDSPPKNVPGRVQPIFSNRKVMTEVSVFDNQTMFFNNLRETEDHGPFKGPGSAGLQLMALVTVHRIVPNEPPR